MEALKPAKVKNLVFDTEKKSVQISVDEDQLSLAIGKKGQNARLTSRLTGWEINIGKDVSATTVVEQKVAQAAQSLAGALPVTEEQALTLVKSGPSAGTRTIRWLWFREARAMSKILDKEQWQRRRAAKLQRANRPRVGLLLLGSQQPRPRQNFQSKN